MSILRTYNVQNPDSASVNVELSAAGGIKVVGVSTLGNTVVGGGTTQLIVTGDARITGILTIGTSSVTLDGTNNQVNVGTGVTIHHSNGVQVAGNTLHSTGLFLNTLNVGTGATIITTTTGGSVGIGSTIPGSKVDVNAGSVSGLSAGTVRNILTISESGSQTSTGQRILFKNVQQNWEQGAITALRETSSNNFSLAFSSSNNGSNIERVRINASGNVGMGTDNPSAKLDVEDNTSSGYIAEFRQKHPSNLGTILIDSPSNSSARSVSLEMSRANTLQWAIGQAYNDSNDSFHIATSSLQSGNTGAKLTIKTNGDVGIGTFNPAYKLDVRGDVLTYGLRMATDLASQTDTGNIASSATNISYRAYGGFQSYTAAVTCNNTWYTLFPNFNYSTGYIIVTAGDAGSKNVQEYAFMTTAPNYGVANFSQLHSMGAWNTGSFELQLSSSGNNYTLQARATSYYSSSNVAGIYMKIISNY